MPGLFHGPMGFAGYGVQPPPGFPQNPFQHPHQQMHLSSLTFSGCENLQCRNYSKAQFQQACNFISNVTGRRMEYVLSDSGANYHIFNDRKWFAGFGDLSPTNVQVTTGGGEVQCKWQGTASFESTDKHI